MEEKLREKEQILEIEGELEVEEIAAEYSKEDSKEGWFEEFNKQTSQKLPILNRRIFWLGLLIFTSLIVAMIHKKT